MSQLPESQNSGFYATQRPSAFGTENVFDGIIDTGDCEPSAPDNGAIINGLESGFETGRDTAMSDIQVLLSPHFCASTAPSFEIPLPAAPALTGLTAESSFFASGFTSPTFHGHNSFVANLTPAPAIFALSGPSNTISPSVNHSHSLPTTSSLIPQTLFQRSMTMTPYQHRPHPSMAHEPVLSMQPSTFTYCTPPSLPTHREVETQWNSQQLTFLPHLDSAVPIQTGVAPANSLPYPTPLGPWLPQTQMLKSGSVFTFSVRFGPTPNGQQHLFHTGLPVVVGKKRWLEEDCASQLHSVSRAFVGFRCYWTGKRTTHCTHIFANEFQLANHVYDTHYDESRDATTRLFSCLWHSGCDNNSTDLHGRPKEPGFADWSNLKRHIMEVHCGITRTMKYGPKKRQKL